jgi:type I restriction enzyme S subunit
MSAHFDTLFITQESIDQLKQAILYLAVNGALVKFPEDSKEITLKEILSFGPRNGFSPKESPNETEQKVLKLGATSYGYLDLSQTKFFEGEIPSGSHLWIKAGDILVQRGNSHNFVGSNVLIEEDVADVIYPDLMMKLRVNKGVMASYVSLWLSGSPARKHMWEAMTGTSGTMPKISKGVVESIPIVVPSMDIQERVVANVKYLLTICDQLKARFDEAKTTQLHLADAIVEQALVR